jgi:hypothetical protein
MAGFGVILCQEGRSIVMRAPRQLSDSPQCVRATLRASGPSSQVRTEIRPCWEVAWAFVVHLRPKLFDPGKHSQVTDAGGCRLGYEGPRQAYFTIAWFLKIPLRDEAPLVDQGFDTFYNGLEPIVVIRHAAPLNTCDISNDPRNF